MDTADFYTIQYARYVKSVNYRYKEIMKNRNGGAEVNVGFSNTLSRYGDIK